jgi:hypothetical protein
LARVQLIQPREKSVKNQHNRRLHKRLPAPRLTPQQIAAARDEAMKWRDAWRRELAAESAELNGQPVLPHKALGAALPDKHAAQFATAVTRAEFGRFYWNDDLAAQVLKSLGRRRKRCTAAIVRASRPDTSGGVAPARSDGRGTNGRDPGA